MKEMRTLERTRKELDDRIYEETMRTIKERRIKRVLEEEEARFNAKIEMKLIIEDCLGEDEETEEEEENAIEALCKVQFDGVGLHEETEEENEEKEDE